MHCHPAYLTYMQSTSCKMPGWMNQKVGIKIAGRNINNLRYADDTTLMAGNEELKSLLMKVKEESEKVGLKLSIWTSLVAQWRRILLPTQGTRVRSMVWEDST